MTEFGIPEIEHGGPIPEGKAHLEELTVRGFRSLADTTLGLRSINVLIGANGSGKSNLVSFFRMLSWMTARPGQLQEWIGQQGGASRLLHYGPETTREIETRLHLRTHAGSNNYEMRLFYSAGDSLRFAEERCQYLPEGANPPYTWTEMGAGHAETALFDPQDGKTVSTILHLLQGIKVHQFQNSSFTSRLRQKQPVNDARYLKEDGGNLAAFLLGLRNNRPDSYTAITDFVRLMYPAFADFLLEPQSDSVRLQWQEQGSDYTFDAHQASDGSIRFFALCALLLQPADMLAPILIVDEPELGLHPQAVQLLAEMVRIASQHSQVILCTQSPLLLDQFDAKDVVVTERRKDGTTFQRLDEGELSSWLGEFEGQPGYSVSELWEKNVIGGGPTA